MVKRLTDYEAKKARERQTQAFEEDKKKKNREKENKKKALLKEVIMNLVKQNERYIDRCIKRRDFLQRIKGRRSSDSISSYQSCLHIEDLKDSRKNKSPKQQARHYLI